MPPKRKECSCRDHDNLSSAYSQVSNIAACKKFKRCALEYLEEHGLLQSYHKYLCEECYAYGLKHATTPKYSFSEFCELIESNEIEDEDFKLLSKSFARLLKLRLAGVVSDYAIQNVQGLQLENLWNNMDIGVREFLLEIGKSNDDKNKYALNTYENLIQLANPRYIGPLNFAQTVISYFISGSRKIVELNAAFSPSGSYATVLDFLKSKAIKEQFLPEYKDCIYFFDNNQVMARNWNVKYDSKPLISVVTTVVCLIPPTVSALQNSEEFIPASWQTVDSIAIAEEVISEKNESFRGYRNEYLQTIIDEMQNVNEGPQPKKIRKISFEPGTSKCTSELREHTDPYEDIPSNVSGKTNVVIMRPIPVNPCSFQSLEIVLDSLVEKANKTWIAVGCDGLPYNLCSKIIDNVFICPHCDEKFQKRNKFETHIANENVNVNIEDYKKYKNILLLPGFGHLDINITKAIFKLLWKVCIKELAQLLGWKSIKALTACENCTDHHKATQILNILFESLTKELLRPFLKDCIEKKEEPNIVNLYSFVSRQNSNYIFLFKCTFTYLLAWKNFKKGMRRGNFNFMKMSLDKLSSLFYGLNMTVYMDLWFRFENMLLKAPAAVKSFVENNVCLSQSGHSSKAEGGDFILESTNKKIKSYMPYGVPTDERWTRVCLNIDNIEKMNNAITSTDSDKDPVPSRYFRHFKDPAAVEGYSVKLRSYLSLQGPHATMDNKSLDKDLVNFDLKCDANKVKYYQNYPDILRICERVFITPEDRAAHFDIANKTKADIQKMVFNLLKEIENAGGVEEGVALRHQWATEVKAGTKTILLTFYRDLVQCLEDVTNKNDAQGNDTEEEDLE